jgi:UDP-N-acetylmuramoyl-tripeptide--D-alanyl-D-alanine ligase
MMTLAEVASVLNAPCTENFELHGVCIDSLQVKPGNLFIAIKGDRFDGHDYIKKAVDNGAVAVICEKQIEDVPVPQLLVKNTIDALAKVAEKHRLKFTCAVIALTGSNGKTTVKEMIASILPKPSYSTQGNYNNHIGAPLSVLNLNSEHRYAVFELGANHQGEIAHTVSIVKPKVTLINNIAPAHIEGFGSIDGVAIAKGEIHQGLAVGGTAVINDDDDYAHYWDSLLEGKNTVHFSVEEPKDVYTRDLTFTEDGRAQFLLVTPKGECNIALNVFGRHSVSNALAAASCAYALGISMSDIQAGLNAFGGVSGRMTRLVGKHGAVIIDDTYNANLKSVLSALDVLAKMKGRRVLVLGDMGELGDHTRSHHQKVGQAAKELGVDEVYTCGTDSKHASDTFGDAGQHFEDQEALISVLSKDLDSQTTILVKGSRSAAMEKVVHGLMDVNEAS